jgi:predicted amidohydrolase
MKLAAYQAPLLTSGSVEALALIRQRVKQCEAEEVAFLCCPEAILGGLADDSDDPTGFAVATGHICAALAPLASDSVTTIVGFTERGDDGRLYNSAAVCHRGTIARATENNVWIVRADVAGRTPALASPGSSEIVRPDGAVVRGARAFAEDMLVADAIPITGGRSDGRT